VADYNASDRQVMSEPGFSNLLLSHCEIGARPGCEDHLLPIKEQPLRCRSGENGNAKEMAGLALVCVTISPESFCWNIGIDRNEGSELID